MRVTTFFLFHCAKSYNCSLLLSCIRTNVGSRRSRDGKSCFPFYVFCKSHLICGLDYLWFLAMSTCNVDLRWYFSGRNHQTIQTSHQADSLGPAHNSHWMIATALLPWCGDKTIDIDWPILPRINARSYQTKHLTSWKMSPGWVPLRKLTWKL